MQESDLAVAESLRKADIEHAPIPESERALLRFVRLMTESAYRIAQADTEQLREAGWSDAQTAEAVYIAALFAFFNRVADAFGLDDPGYTIPNDSDPESSAKE